MDSNVTTIEQEVLGWLGLPSAPGRFSAVAFRYGKREIGHIDETLGERLRDHQVMKRRKKGREDGRLRS